MMMIGLEKRLLTVEEYHQMGEYGILKNEDKVELIHGEIIKINPYKSLPTSCVKRITSLFYQLFGELATISVQDPIVLNIYSEPEPDIALLNYSADFYAKAHPRPKDVILLIEVSDSTLEFDRGIKLALYAEAGIQEYWIVNLTENQIEVHQNPEGKNYKLRKIYTSKDHIQLQLFSKRISVSEILP